MKTLVNRCGAVAVAALVLLVLAAGCSAPPEGIQYPPLPEGMGVVKLNFNNNLARTIVPETAGLEFFNAFEMEFIGTGADATSKTIYRNSSTKESPVELGIGSYTLDVRAYAVGTIGDGLGITTATVDDLGASTTASISFSVTAGNTRGNEAQIGPIVLHVQNAITATGTGNFGWDITYNVDGGEVRSTVFTIKDIDGSNPQTVNATKSHDVETGIDSGYYLVELAITVQNDESSLPEEVFRSQHVLHIYANNTSFFTYIFNYDGETGIILYAIAADWTISQNEIENVPWSIAYSKAATFTGPGTPVAEAAVIDLEKGNGDVITFHRNPITPTDFSSSQWYFWDDFATPTAQYINESGDITFDLSDPANLLMVGREYDVTIIGFMGTGPTAKPYSFRFKINIIQ